MADDRRTRELRCASRGLMGQLELREGLGQGYHLNGRPVAEQDRVELLMPDGSWVLGHFRWTGRRHESPRLSLGEDEGLAFLIRPDAVLRWPESAPARVTV